MPWCAECDRFLSPATVTPDGRCPRCGRAVDPGRARSAADPEPSADAASGPPSAPSATGPARGPESGAPVEDPDDPLPPVPWHLKLLVGAVVFYLGWRAFQGIEWVVHQR